MDYLLLRGREKARRRDLAREQSKLTVLTGTVYTHYRASMATTTPGRRGWWGKRLSASTLLLIDDHPLFLSGISLVLREGLKQVEVLEAGSLSEALQLRHADPALILLDQQLQGVSGVTGIAALRRKWPATKVALLSGCDMSALRDEALAAGAVAFISKTDKPRTLLHQVRALLDDHGLQEPAGSEPSVSESLTARQVEVLELLCRGLSNKAIAQHLHLSEYTVRGHVQTLLGLLGASSRGEAAFNARHRGWIV